MSEIVYKLGRLTDEEHMRLDFEDGFSRSVQERISLGLVPIRLPVIDDAPYRIFATMSEYRRWAKSAVPDYLGYCDADA